MPNILHLYGAGSDLTAATGHVGLLCEIAPDSRLLHGAQWCYRADEMLGSQDAALRVAHPLVRKLIESVSTIEDLPILTVFEEPLLEQLSYIVQTFRLDRWISSKGFTECRFASYSPWLERLRQVREVTESRYALIGDLPFGQGNRAYRTIEKLRQSVSRPSELIRRVAPLWSRYWSARMRKPSAPRGGIWFYSTAHNYTRIGLEYEGYLPEKMNFLVEDAATGGKQLRKLGRDFHVLYAWARASDIPGTSEVRSFGDRVVAAVLSVPLMGEQSVLRSVLLRGEWWHLFVKRWLAFAIFHGRVLQRWCQFVAPEMVVVGNAGWERALLQYRGAEHIPSAMLQHGIMHWVYAVADQPVTRFLLRGKFFQGLINEDLRRKTVICNYPQARGTTIPSKVNSRGKILFITTPYDVPALFHRGDLRDILRSMLHVSHAYSRQLVIRVHPLERISYYQQIVSEMQEESGFDGEVAYSQGSEVDDLLAQSCVAVLYFSTMFLDCLRHGVPMISFGWHWFPNKVHFEEAGVFNFASDLRNLEQLVQDAIEGKLPSRHDGLEDFLAPSHPEEIAKVFRELWASRPA